MDAPRGAPPRYSVPVELRRQRISKVYIHAHRDVFHKGHLTLFVVNEPSKCERRLVKRELWHPKRHGHWYHRNGADSIICAARAFSGKRGQQAATWLRANPSPPPSAQSPSVLPVRKHIRVKLLSATQGLLVFHRFAWARTVKGSDRIQTR